MDDVLLKVQRWAMHGTVRQSFADMSARLSAVPDYTVELAGETINFFRMKKEGGLLGLFSKTVKEPVLTIRRVGEEVEIPDEPRDAEFIEELSRILQAH